MSVDNKVKAQSLYDKELTADDSDPLVITQLPIASSAAFHDKGKSGKTGVPRVLPPSQSKTLEDGH